MRSRCLDKSPDVVLERLNTLRCCVLRGCCGLSSREFDGLLGVSMDATRVSMIRQRVVVL